MKSLSVVIEQILENTHVQLKSTIRAIQGPHFVQDVKDYWVICITTRNHYFPNHTRTGCSTCTYLLLFNISNFMYSLKLATSLHIPPNFMVVFLCLTFA